MANLNLRDILDMFQNGERRYAEDPAFKAAVDSLKMGLGVYAVLDHVLKENGLMRGNYKALADSRQKLSYELEIHLNAEPKGIYMGREVYPNELETLREENQKLKDEVAGYKDALQHYQK